VDTAAVHRLVYSVEKLLSFSMAVEANLNYLFGYTVSRHPRKQQKELGTSGALAEAAMSHQIAS
jgi:hypothetical protein